MRKAALLPIEALRFSKKKRKGICPRRVNELIAELESGQDMYPIRVNDLGNGTYTIKDGRHRVQAHIELGITHIQAYIENTIRRLLRWLYPAYAGYFISMDISSKKD